MNEKKSHIQKAALVTLVALSSISLLTGCKKEEVKEIKPLKVEEDLNVKESTIKKDVVEIEIKPTSEPKETTTYYVEPSISKVEEETTKPKNEVNLGGADVEFTEEELKEPSIDFAKLQEELKKQQEAQLKQQQQQVSQQQSQQAKQGTDKNGHPYLAPGAQYTWTNNGPLEAPPDGKSGTTTTNPNTGEVFVYSKPSGRWIGDNEAESSLNRAHEKFQKSMEGTRKLTPEEAKLFGERFSME